MVALSTVIATPTREAKKIACFSKKPSVLAQKIEQAIVDCAIKLQIKGEFQLSELWTTTPEYIITDNTNVHIYLHLILYNFVSTKDTKRLDTCSALFRYFHTMIFHMKPKIICDLLQYDPDY